ncbi:hypothetical protein ACVWY3_001603 [Bradyrhizobium sp. USDA 4486]
MQSCSNQPAAASRPRLLALSPAERAEATRQANGILGVTFDYVIPLAPDGEGFQAYRADLQSY